MKSFDCLLATIVSVLFLLILMQNTDAAASRGSVDLVLKGLKKGDTAVVEKYLIPLAEAGDPRAQFNLGVAYLEGDGVEKDQRKAFEWTMRAAEAGDTRAEVNLANFYLEGRGTAKNPHEALRWLSIAATGGDELAQLALARMYRDGKHVERDYRRAFDFMAMSAEAGSIEARYELAEMYENGWGTRRDKSFAKKIYADLEDHGYSKKSYSTE